MREIPTALGFFADEDGNIWRGTKKMNVHPKGRDGYLGTALCQRGWVRHDYVHRLVCEAYHGPCPDGQQCRHLNGARDDNRPSNLAWGTIFDQVADKKRHGTFPKPRAGGPLVQLNMKIDANDKCALKSRAKAAGKSVVQFMLDAALGERKSQAPQHVGVVGGVSSYQSSYIDQCAC